MKTIKFRAWDKKNQVIRSVDEIMNLWDGGQTYIINQMPVGEDLKLIVGKDCELMQYTGLKDKHGKEIWEGDVLKYSDEGEEWIDEVKFEDIYIKPFVNFRNWGTNFETEGKYFEIIGNIYSNPELLTN